MPIQVAKKVFKKREYVFEKFLLSTFNFTVV